MRELWKLLPSVERVAALGCVVVGLIVLFATGFSERHSFRGWAFASVFLVACLATAWAPFARDRRRGTDPASADTTD